MENDDIELTVAALEACGYRCHVREKADTRWVTAAKGLQVQFVHWHPLTNINQAMQLLIDMPGNAIIYLTWSGVEIGYQGEDVCEHVVCPTGPAPQDLINAQCRAVVTACASLKAVR